MNAYVICNPSKNLIGMHAVVMVISFNTILSLGKKKGPIVKINRYKFVNEAKNEETDSDKKQQNNKHSNNNNINTTVY